MLIFHSDINMNLIINITAISEISRKIFSFILKNLRFLLFLGDLVLIDFSIIGQLALNWLNVPCNTDLFKLNMKYKRSSFCQEDILPFSSMVHSLCTIKTIALTFYILSPSTWSQSLRKIPSTYKITHAFEKAKPFVKYYH